jgi:SNF2 family DNA or RNA helicase
VHSLAQSRIVVLDALLKLRQACCDPRLVKLPSARKVETSSKLDDLLEMMIEMLSEGRRILLFSQFTSMVDLIMPRLVEAGITFAELRGDTRDRAEPVRKFEAGEVPVFLISLTAGGRGLNLTSADTVIHYDPWWNPAVEDQASDRAHRIGQTKSVFVYKMIAADTVEERIVELQERKAALAKIAFSDGEDLPSLEFDEIEYLFGRNPEKMAA